MFGLLLLDSRMELQSTEFAGVSFLAIILQAFVNCVSDRRTKNAHEPTLQTPGETGGIEVVNIQILLA